MGKIEQKRKKGEIGRDEWRRLGEHRQKKRSFDVWERERENRRERREKGGGGEIRAVDWMNTDKKEVF
jgi:hypothetical protein